MGNIKKRDTRPGSSLLGDGSPTTKGIGDLDVLELPDSPHWSFDQIVKCTRTFKGAYDDLLSAVPVRGSTMTGFATGMFVLNSDLQRNPGNRGTLTVNLAGSQSGDGTGALRITEELDWVSLDKSLKRHPRFGADGDYPMTDRDWELIDAWISTGIHKLSDLVGEGDADTADLQAYGKLILRGVENYRVYLPKIIVNSTFSTEPATPTCGDIFNGSTPTTSAGHAVAMMLPELNGTTAYVWMKTAARKTQNADRTWNLVEEFTGVEEIETFIYPIRDSGDPSSASKPAGKATAHDPA